MNAGIICDLSFTRHVCFKNYYYALKNYFPNLKVVSNFLEVKKLDILFIGNEHFGPHKDIWSDNSFIHACNSNKVDVFVFSAEKIFNSSFEHNERIQNKLEKFNRLYQYPCDVEDAKILNRPILRSCMSKYYMKDIGSTEKNDKCVFIGNVDCPSYAGRRDMLSKIKELYPIDFVSGIESWKDYFETISKYRFVLSPLGNALAFNLRFYEILTAKSIPVQQVQGDMLNYYNIESNFEDCIFFSTAEECVEKIVKSEQKVSHNNIWLEDHIRDLLSHDKILIG